MKTGRRGAIAAGLGFTALAGWAYLERHRIGRAAPLLRDEIEQAVSGPPALYHAKPEPWAAALVAAAESQIGVTVRYDPAYVRIGYPQGDVPLERGVCTDVVIRAYRDAFGFDLQQQIHEDMRRDFAAYPQLWNLPAPDPNIDHRRVPNLATFFRRKGAALKLSRRPGDYRPEDYPLENFQPGDVVTYLFPSNRTHIAIVSDKASRDGKRPLIIHNSGLGTRRNDRLFAYRITGHFRFPPPAASG